MAININNTGRSIAVSSKNGYTIEKVKKAVEFVKHATRRGTKLEEYLKMYNYLRDSNDTLPNCKVCGAAKYIASVENYAKYGYLTLVASGVDPELLNGKKDTNEGSIGRNDVSAASVDGREEDKVQSVETQKGTQETSEGGEDSSDSVVGDTMVQSEEDTVEVAESDSTETNKRKNKRVKKA